jgi:hypothetical protein
MAADATVEWGEDRPVRLIDRIFGDRATGPVSRLSLPAVAAGVISVALFAVAEVLPWISIQSSSVPGAFTPGLPNGRETSIEGVADGAVFAYYIGVVLLLMVVSAALVGRPHARRSLTATGFGLVAALLVVVLGLIAKAGEGGDLALFYDVDATAGSGPYVAIAAVAAAAAALALSGWHPHRAIGRRSAADVDDDDDSTGEPGPIDLTVSSG